VNAPVRRTFVASDGARLSVLAAAPAAPANPALTLAFIPGWCMPAALFEPQLVALGERWRVAALDPRGQGESDVAAGGYTSDRRADDIADFLAPFPRVVLVGWSLGALEALHYIHRHGEAKLAGLVLVDSSVGEDPPPPASGFRDALRADRAAAVADFVRAIFRAPPPAEELAKLAAVAQRMPLAASIDLLSSSWPREHWRSLVRGVRAPLLYAVTPQFAAQSRNLERHRPGSRVEIFADAGHALFADEPERFNALLTDFVSSLA
jgi:non-heme chloroperoxidase